jgi:hypothetical protein
MGIKRNDDVPVQMPPDFMLALPSRDVLCFPQTGLCQQSRKLQSEGEVPQVR